MYPSADVDRYLTIKELLISEQAQTACPGGIVKITKVDVDLKGDFEVNGSKSEATVLLLSVNNIFKLDSLIKYDSTL